MSTPYYHALADLHDQCPQGSAPYLNVLFAVAVGYGLLCSPEGADQRS